jgi:hypothetical protein
VWWRDNDTVVGDVRSTSVVEWYWKVMVMGRRTRKWCASGCVEIASVRQCGLRGTGFIKDQPTIKSLFFYNLM